ncbi:WSC domain-containing protein [Physcia stellaris]|nr:WSC domain-containing protein [Physcia stellaris]
MARLVWTALLCLTLVMFDGAVAATWPSSIDELEDIMYLNTGYRARAFAAPVTPCSFSAEGSGRQAAAEYVRTAFHDMATGSVFFGTGGMDASIIFELGGGTGDQGDNIGPAFPSTLTKQAPFFSSKSSMADIIALGMYSAVRSCGGPAIPFRSGRVDATEAGPVGVPLPQNSLFTFQNQFSRMGFNATEMIQVVACGHTLGGVHSTNFPQIVPPGSSPQEVVHFDTTTQFDEKIASEYVAGTTKDPLVVGPAKSVGRDSDYRVFNSDGNATISAMANPTTFQNTCKGLLQRMIDLVPKAVVLTDPILPYDVKPVALQLTLLGGGSNLQFTGEIRVRTTSRQVASVALIYKDRSGASSCGACKITTTLKGNAAGFDDSFAFYGFSSQLPSTSSISGFNVVVTYTSGATETYNNGGAGFPVQDQIMLQSSQSCLSSNKLTVVAAVRSTSGGPASLDLTLKVPRTGIIVPALQTQSVAMTKGTTVGPYDLYSATYTLDASQTQNTKFDLSLGSGVKDSFKGVGDLGATCSPLDSRSPSSTTMITSTKPSSSTKSTSSTKPSTSSKPTSSTKTTAKPSSSTKPSASTPTLSGYTYEGCYTDNTNGRVLNGRSTSSNSMSYNFCASFCSGYAYIGLEFGRECYCGQSYAATTTLAPPTDCSSKCSGDSTQLCGAGNRMNVFKSTDKPPSTATIPGWGYQGCYTDSGSARTLAGKVVYNSAMTNELCAAGCKGFKYFGTEYASQCYCGNDLPGTTAKVGESGMY